MKKVYLNKTKATMPWSLFVKDTEVIWAGTAISQIDILGVDSNGGFIGALGEEVNLEDNAPICYIYNNRECFQNKNEEWIGALPVNLNWWHY